jgi:threonyl-tRNA synthetase
MKKNITKQDFDETVGPMNAVALEDAIAYVGVDLQKQLTHDDVSQVLAKKKKIVKSDVKHQRMISKTAIRMDWAISEDK